MKDGPAKLRRKIARQSAVFEAIAHPTRREILLVLNFRGGAMSAGQIAERFSCRWPTVTRHLGVLQRAGLVRATRRGRERIYRIERKHLSDSLTEWLRWFVPSDPRRDDAS